MVNNNKADRAEELQDRQCLKVDSSEVDIKADSEKE
jgi:hypothetical protein